MVSAERQLNVHNKSINKHNQSVQNDFERLTNETLVSDNFRTLNDTNEALSSDFSDFDHTVSFNSLCNHSIVSEAQFPISSNICLNNSCHTPDASSRESWFKKKGLNIMHLNIHYLHSKLEEIKILLYEQPNIDIVCLCERVRRTDSIKFKISPKTPRGKKDSTKRHHDRHHKRQPGEQQFPKQVVTG